jgi:hypothetical protein
MLEYNKSVKTSVNNNINKNPESNYLYFHFDMKYEKLSPIIKDIQLVSQLIRFVKKDQLSDLILINGINTYTAESRFYFNYRNICDFYVKVLDLVENENSTQIKYYIYKTRPSSIGFIVILSISKINNGSKISIELQLFNKKILSSLFLNIIYNEFKLMFKYLIESIRKNKQQFLLFNSNIIKSDFDFLSQIIQNKKIIKYLINGQFNKITIDEHDSHVIFNENDNNSFISTNDIYKIVLKKKNNNKILYDYINDNNIIFKIKSIKINEDNLSIQYEVLSNNSNNKNDNAKCTNNLFTIIIRKLTDNYSFILIKYIWDKSLDKNIIFDIKKFINKILAKIEKVCKITSQ